MMVGRKAFLHKHRGSRQVAEVPCWVCDHPLTIVVKQRPDPKALTLKGCRHVWRPAKGHGEHPQPICGAKGCLAHAEFSQAMDCGWLVPLTPWQKNRDYAVYDPYKDPSPKGREIVHDQLFRMPAIDFASSHSLGDIFRSNIIATQRAAEISFMEMRRVMQDMSLLTTKSTLSIHLDPWHLGYDDLRPSQKDALRHYSLTSIPLSNITIDPLVL